MPLIEWLPGGNNTKRVYSPGMVGLAPKWVKLDPKFDKSGNFSDQISVHMARFQRSQNLRGGSELGHMDRKWDKSGTF